MNRIAITIIGAAAVSAGLTAAASSAVTGQTEKTENTPVADEVPDSVAIPTYDELDEVVVVGARPVVKTDGATTTYSVDDDPSSTGMTLLDMLRKVPMVSVDGEDNIRLKGEQNFKILVNGKEDPTLSANASQILKMMPANAVSRIEVITEPGAKYDAEGTGGVINLITISNQSQDGYSVGLDANFSNRFAGASGNVRVKTGNVTIGANVDYANGRMFNTRNYADNTTIYKDPQTGMPISILTGHSDQNSKFDFLGAGLKMSWDMTPSDLVTVNLNFNRVKGDVSGFTDRSHMNEAIVGADGSVTEGRRLWSYASDLTGGMTNVSTTAMASYQHSFPGDRNDLVISYQFSYGRNLLDAFTHMVESENYAGVPWTRNYSLNINREHTAQIDYTNNFNSSKHLLETGAKLIIRRNGDDSYMAFGPEQESVVGSDADRTDMTQLQDVGAVYASYTGNFGPVSAKGGLRYEHTRMGNRYHMGELEDFTRNLNDVVPNAAVSYSFSPTENLRLAYQMRISRPTISQVSPYVFAPMPFEKQMGNPDLKSEHSNNVSLTYSNFAGVIGGNIGVEYNQVDNMISDYVFIDNGVRVSTYGNIGHKRSGALNGFLMWTIIPRMSLSLNGRVEYLSLKSVSPDYSNHGWQGNWGANWNYMLTSGWSFTAFGGHGTRNLNLQGYHSGWHYYGIGVTKSLLKDQSLKIGVTANNFLEKEQKYPSFQSTHEADIKRVWCTKNWNLGINISWNFGNLRQDIKKTSVDIVNDDQSKASNGSFGNS